MTSTRIVVALLLAFASSAPVLHADSCTAIKDLKLPDTTITLAERVTSGDLDAPGIDKPFHELPPFCRVVGSASTHSRFRNSLRSLAAGKRLE